jgi:hypothetical protein
MDCIFCRGHGYLIVKEPWGNSFVEKIAYCPHCKAGERWKYNGRASEKRKTPYVIRSSEEYIQEGKVVAHV